MTTRGGRHGWFAVAATILGAVLLVASVTAPVARTGIGSTLSLHRLFDLVLAGNLPMDVPRWLGLSGYLPAISGAVLLLAEAMNGRLRAALRSCALVVAVASVGAIVVFGPWDAPENLGLGSWLGLAGVGCALVSAGSEFSSAVRRRPSRSDESRHGGVDADIRARDRHENAVEMEGARHALPPVWS